MTVELRDTTACATGEVGIEDAAVLGEWLAAGKVSHVEVYDVSHLHGAALQLLLQHRPALLGVPKDGFTAQLLSPLQDAMHQARP